MLLKLVWILIMFEGKYHQENAKNGISERLDFEIFWGSMPPDPPKRSRLRRFRIASVIRKIRLVTALTLMLFDEKERCQCRIAYIVL